MNTTLESTSVELVDPRQQVRERAAEINRLHAEVLKLEAESRQSLVSAVTVAWQVGQLLLAEKQRIRQMGGGAWLLWLEHNFHGTPRTAQRYMCLAQEESDVSKLQGLSIRQAYFRLGIATEPKSESEFGPPPQLPPYIRLAHKLMVALPSADSRQMAPEQREAYRRDLRMLYERLRRLFETDAASTVSPRLAGRV